jgi:hypothetical protein
MALIGAMITVFAEGGAGATIKVHAPDGEGRVFVDVVGTINDRDFETFKEKTDPIYPIGAGHSMIVTLVSNGGSISSALQIGERIRKRGMSTFVPGDRTCTSACALIWLAGVPRTGRDIPRLGFHAAYNPTTRLETGVGNAMVGAYLRDLGVSYKAIGFMTRKGPTHRMVDPRFGNGIRDCLSDAWASENNSHPGTKSGAPLTTACRDYCSVV